MREIIGVVGDVKHQSLKGDAAPEFWFPQAQMPVKLDDARWSAPRRTPVALVAPIRGVVREMDANAPVFAVLTVEEYLSRSVASTPVQHDAAASRSPPSRW
jgi:hypothetical protein